jgi:hypothetical protein
MIDFLLACVCSSAVCVGAHVAMQNRMILHFYYEWIRKLPLILFKPLGGCLPCMASVWGGASFIAFNYLAELYLSYWLTIPAILVICLLNVYFWALIPEDEI